MCQVNLRHPELGLEILKLDELLLLFIENWTSDQPDKYFPTQLAFQNLITTWFLQKQDKHVAKYEKIAVFLSAWYPSFLG